jgi:hypothetical protein
MKRPPPGRVCTVDCRCEWCGGVTLHITRDPRPNSGRVAMVRSKQKRRQLGALDALAKAMR